MNREKKWGLISNYYEKTFIKRKDKLTGEIRQCKQLIKALFLFYEYEEPQALKHLSNKSNQILYTIPMPESEKSVFDSHRLNFDFCKKEQKQIDSQLNIIKQRSEHNKVITTLITVPWVGFINAITFHLELFNPEKLTNMKLQLIRDWHQRYSATKKNIRQDTIFQQVKHNFITCRLKLHGCELQNIIILQAFTGNITLITNSVESNYCSFKKTDNNIMAITYQKKNLYKYGYMSRRGGRSAI